MKENIVLIGLPGSGKTTLGRLLSQRLGLQFVDIDVEIERHTHKTISELFEKGETYFRDIETEVTTKVAQARQTIISTGGGVVLRHNNMIPLQEKGLIIFLNRSVKSITGDIDIQMRPLLKDGVERLNKLHDQRNHLYHQYADIVIDNDTSLEETVERIIEHLPKTLSKH
ncbi:shikimate kinase [Fundicoccus sp. Sow4_F4]|uniref:shikimate kinase n=1 Tax=Fundicoccus sp. Sow4_F4 TaxID=3438783 RepID=UPI003F90903A